MNSLKNKKKSLMDIRPEEYTFLELSGDIIGTELKTFRNNIFNFFA